VTPICDIEKITLCSICEESRNNVGYVSITNVVRVWVVSLSCEVKKFMGHEFNIKIFWFLVRKHNWCSWMKFEVFIYLFIYFSFK